MSTAKQWVKNIRKQMPAPPPFSEMKEMIWSVY